MHGAVNTTGHICSGTLLGNQLQKIGVNTNSKIQFPGVQVQLKQRRGLTHRKEIAHFDNSHRRSKQQFDNNSQDPDVIHRHSGISGENSPNGQVAYEALPMVPENPLEVSPIIGQKDTMFNNFEKTSDMVEKSKKCTDRLPPSCRGTQSPVVHRCICQGLGCTFGRPDSQWTVVRHRGKFAYKHSGIESSVFGNKVFSNPSNEQEGLGGLRQCNSSVIPQQARGDPLNGNVSYDMHLMTFCNPRAILLRARHIQGCLNVIADSLFRRDMIIQTEWSLHPKIFQQKPMIDMFATKMINKLPLPVPSPRSKCDGSRCIEYLVGGTRRLCLLSNSSHTRNVLKNENLCLPNDCSRPRVSGDELVFGSSRTLHKTSTITSTLGNSSQTAFQSEVPSKSPISQSACLASGFETKSPQKFSKSVAERIKAPQRFSSRRVYESRWTIFKSWCKENQVEFKKPPLSSIADFFTYLFNEKSLKPTTIAGYRTAIADHLGPARIEISHSFQLNRLISSFHRDRPVKDRSIPSWHLSLVLLALTKPPFEPLKDAALKILTFKTVFLMTLASGGRRGEVHAWTFKSLKHKTGWKEVTVAPSSVFLAKNQLASDGPSIVQLVVIPALKPTLDHSLSEDMTLCPVRSLRYYIDKTKDLRVGKHLLFISFKNGFSGDIQRSTISSWIKQTVMLAYQGSGLETQNLSKVKAHDVRSMAASLAFKGGVSLDQILGACFWKSHTTFTNFYLKDMAWKSKEGSEYSLGSVVSAQHIVKL